MASSQNFFFRRRERIKGDFPGFPYEALLYFRRTPQSERWLFLLVTQFGASGRKRVEHKLRLQRRASRSRSSCRCASRNVWSCTTRSWRTMVFVLPRALPNHLITSHLSFFLVDKHRPQKPIPHNYMPGTVDLKWCFGTPTKANCRSPRWSSGNRLALLGRFDHHSEHVSKGGMSIRIRLDSPCLPSRWRRTTTNHHCTSYNPRKQKRVPNPTIRMLALAATRCEAWPKHRRM